MTCRWSAPPATTARAGPPLLRANRAAGGRVGRWQARLDVDPIAGQPMYLDLITSGAPLADWQVTAADKATPGVSRVERRLSLEVLPARAAPGYRFAASGGFAASRAAHDATLAFALRGDVVARRATYMRAPLSRRTPIEPNWQHAYVGCRKPGPRSICGAAGHSASDLPLDPFAARWSIPLLSSSSAAREGEVLIEAEQQQLTEVVHCGLEPTTAVSAEALPVVSMRYR